MPMRTLPSHWAIPEEEKDWNKRPSVFGERDVVV
jgi:hypothetical protein